MRIVKVTGGAVWGRGERRLRRVYHVDVDEDDRPNLLAANMAVRQVTGRIRNARPMNEII